MVSSTRTAEVFSSREVHPKSGEIRADELDEGKQKSGTGEGETLSRSNEFYILGDFLGCSGKRREDDEHDEDDCELHQGDSVWQEGFCRQPET